MTVCLRLELNDGVGWFVNNYAEKFDLSLDSVHDNVERINVNEVSHEQFVEKYEKLYKPVVITGACDNWKAKYKWNLKVSIDYILFDALK